MNKLLPKIAKLSFVTIKLPASKSESNRLLILQALSDDKIVINNLSNANDTVLLQQALQSESAVIDVADAGTAMRFLLAYFCAKNEPKILKGSERMHQRPIAELVDALRNIGFDIDYLEQEGYAPLAINPINLDSVKNETIVNSSVSSQFISALLLIAWQLPNGLTLNLEGDVISAPYIDLTIALLEQVAVNVNRSQNSIYIPNQTLNPSKTAVQSDWTNASYWYALLALGRVGEQLFLSGLKNNSAQGDKIIAQWGEKFGIKTHFESDRIRIEKIEKLAPKFLSFDCIHHPDLAQTLVVLCAALGIKAEFSGLQSLRIKEADRIVALQIELKKFGIEFLEIAEDTFSLNGTMTEPSSSVATYNDHRMAMAFAPLCRKFPLEIENPLVVRKSYPNFWEDMQKLFI